jgi:1-acyl-sn-glycerol-3-phosphate acyltransferase
VEPWYRLTETVLRPPIKLYYNWHFEGMEHLPREGAALVACNHISYFDPLAQGLFVSKCGRRPRFMAKSELYENWFLRRVLEGTKQIKVFRGTGDTAPVENAKQALRDGEVVMIYPEGTRTRNPDFTPMQGKRGIARLTLATDTPVIPLAVWGSQHVDIQHGVHPGKFGRPIWVKAGVPMDFSAYSGQADDSDALRQVTEQVMAELSRLVGDMRSRYPKRWA